MSNIAIKIEGLGKRYRYGAVGQTSDTLRSDLTEWARGLFRRGDRSLKTEDRRLPASGSSPQSSTGSSGFSLPSSVSSLQSPATHHESLHEVHERHLNESPSYFWALKDINLEVRQGEVVGIIGRNGAGKSTLLKILSRITPPTIGKITYNGRIASLLEVGTGFHRELTGRENILLNGSILGMKRAEIAKKFDEIVAFAEVEKFIDTPVKFYSSGMYVRLAFAVAAHLEPEILVLDEVLAVGDASFQKKCLGKMGDVAKQGRTVIFVSHNMIAINSLCQRAVLLKSGCMVKEGAVSSVVTAYLGAGVNQTETVEWQTPDKAPGTDELRVTRIHVSSDGSNGTHIPTMQTPLKVETDYWILRADVQLHLTYHLLNEQGIVVLTTGSGAARRARGHYRGSFTLPANLLNSGGYSLNLLIVKNENQVVFTQESIMNFSIVDSARRDHACMGREPSVLQIPIQWEVSAQ